MRSVWALLASLLLVTGCGTRPERLAAGPASPGAMNADSVLAVDGHLVPLPDGQGYTLHLAIKNKTAAKLELLYDCERPFFPRGSMGKRSTDCRQFYSSALEANGTRRFEGAIPAAAVEGKLDLLLEVAYGWYDDDPHRLLVVQVPVDR